MDLHWKGVLLTLVSLVLNGLSMKVGLAGAESQPTPGCTLPESWRGGSWFQREHIDSSLEISEHSMTRDQRDQPGRCLSIEKKDHYIFFNINDGEKCTRCIFIHELHSNVLRYSQSNCKEVDGIHSNAEMCEKIHESSSSGLLYLFRENPNDSMPIECPFSREAPFNMEYTKSTKPCIDSASSVKSCYDKNQLAINFEGCPDLQGSESKKEELTCIGKWAEGGINYFVATVKEEIGSKFSPVPGSFRCYAYSSKVTKDKRVVHRVSTMEQPTCDGLTDSESGEMRFSLTQKKEVQSSCSFPLWFTSKEWHSLDHNSKYKVFGAKTSEIFIHSSDVYGLWEPREKIVCLKSESDSTGNEKVVILSNEINGCTTQRKVCLVLTKLSDNFSLMQVAHKMEFTEEELISNCLKIASGNESSLNFRDFTLFAQGTEPINCPMKGKFSITNYESRAEKSCESDEPLLSEPRTVDVGCKKETNMEFFTNCTDKKDSIIGECFGSWKKNEDNYLLVSFQRQGSNNSFIYCFRMSKDTKNGFMLIGYPFECQPTVQANMAPKPSSFIMNYKDSCSGGESLQISSGPRISSGLLLFIGSLFVLLLNNV